MGLTLTLPPPTGWVPAQLGSWALDAVQAVALVLPQVSVLEPPSPIVFGAATSEAVGAGPTVTVALAEGLLAPPAPVQTTEYVAVVVGETDTLPLAAPAVEKPVPVQPKALVLLQASVLDPPEAITPGVAVSDAVTAEPTVTVAFAGAVVAPPAPVQVTE